MYEERINSFLVQQNMNSSEDHGSFFSWDDGILDDADRQSERERERTNAYDMKKQN
jgi:hypothetical protein